MNLNELYNELTQTIEGWLIAFVRMLPNFAIALLILIIVFFIAKIIRRFSRKQLIKFRVDNTISGFLSRLISLFIIVIGFMVALSVMNLTGTVTSLLAGLGILGLALGFAFQDTAANFMSGIYITFQQPYAVGDIIETMNGTMGNVIDINLRVTKIKTFDGQIVYVPNRFLFQEDFKNFSEHGSRRMKLACGVSYGEDLERVEKIAIEALQDVPGRVTAEDIKVHWTEFGDSSINFTVNIWVDYTQQNSVYVSAESYSLKTLKQAFDNNDIMIPFPIRTLDFGIKGGVPFNEAMSKVDIRDNSSKSAEKGKR